MRSFIDANASVSTVFIGRQDRSVTGMREARTRLPQDLRLLARHALSAHAAASCLKPSVMPQSARAVPTGRQHPVPVVGSHRSWCYLPTYGPAAFAAIR